MHNRRGALLEEGEQGRESLAPTKVRPLGSPRRSRGSQ